MIPQRRLSTSAGNIPRTSDQGPRTSDQGPRTSDQGPQDLGPGSPGPRTRVPRISDQGPQTRKRVRFLDRAFAQELIHREKARLEEKIKALRQAYDFRQAVSGKSYPDETRTPPEEQQRRDSCKLQAVMGPDEREEKAGDAPKRRHHHQRKRKHRYGSLSADRLSELAKPKSRIGMLPINSSRRNAIVAASPEHLKLSVAERSPRTFPQLRHLAEDEVDYLVQPKTVQEFQQLAEISFPPSILKRPQNGSESGTMTGAGGTPSYQDNSPPCTRGIRRRDTSGQLGEPRPGVDTAKPSSSTPAKPSFKMAALGVISMKTQYRHDMAPKSPPVNISDLFAKSLPPKLALQQRAKNSLVSFDLRPDVPGGRVLRLRPRKSAWLESRMKERPNTVSNPSADERGQVGETEGTVPPTEPPRNRSRATFVAFATPLKYHKWRDKPAIDVEELTKNLSKCSYLRGSEDGLDIKDVFAR